MRFPDALRRTLWSCEAILWLASWLVPRPQRAAWRQGQIRDVRHWTYFLADRNHLNRENKLELARHCWGGFRDAFWIRYDRERFLRQAERLRGAPSNCLALLALLVLVIMLAGGFIPAARSHLSSAISRPERVCVVSLNGKFRRLRSETLLDLASAWQGSKLLSAVAPYSWGPGKLADSKRAIPILTARVAPEFFELLGVNAVLGRTFRPDDARRCPSCIVLSNEIWKLQFQSAHDVVGRQVMVDGGQKTIVGVLPANFRLLPSSIAVWTLLDPGAPPFSNFVERIGAVARMNDGASEAQVEADLSDLTENAGYVFPASLLSVSSARSDMRRSVETYLLFLLLAVSCAACVVYVRESDGLGLPPASLGAQYRWWTFFVGKSVLLLIATGLLASASVRWWSVHLTGSLYPMVDGIALWLFLVLSVGSLSWAIHDQQRRCRACLRRLGSPIRIGAPGHVLLSWSGTEMVCSEGHGVLYLPDSHAEWVERERWDMLDESWADLFKNSDTPDKGNT